MLLSYFADFAAGFFLCNAIPHLAAGLRGEAFPTPFAKPHGVGLSSAPINFLWGTLNLVLGLWLLEYSAVSAVWSLQAGVLLAGFLLHGLYLSRHFAKGRGTR